MVLLRPIHEPHASAHYLFASHLTDNQEWVYLEGW
jgi:hypothetical protein